MKNWVLLLLALLLMSLNAYAQSDVAEMSKQCEFNGTNYQNAVTFVKDLQAAVRANNTLKISHLVEYPLRINTDTVNGEKHKITHQFITTQKAFIQNYDAIITKTLKAKILQHNPTIIFCNYQGAMIADGGIWFMEKNNTIHIIAINKD